MKTTKHNSPMQQIFSYLKKGFSLINAHPWLYFLAAGSYIVFYYFSEYSHTVATSVSFFVTIFSFLLAIIFLAVHLSLPVFFKLMKEKRHLQKTLFISTLRRNIRRVGVFLVTAFICLLMIFIVAWTIQHGSTPYRSHVSTQQGTYLTQYHPLNLQFFSYVFFALCGALILNFAALFFSIEEKSIVSSMKEGVIFFIQNFSYTSTLFLLLLLVKIVQNFFYLLPMPHETVVFIAIVVSQYINIGIFASILLYYLDKKKFHK